MSENLKELESGFAWDAHFGVAYAFEHFPMRKGRNLQKRAARIHVVETINGTLANANKHSTSEKVFMSGAEVHRNRYFAQSLFHALALAARMQSVFVNDWIAEEVVCIRHATKEEAYAAKKLFEHYHAQMPDALAELPADE